jgi:hypothetical protein
MLLFVRPEIREEMIAMHEETMVIDPQSSVPDVDPTIF